MTDRARFFAGASALAVGAVLLVSSTAPTQDAPGRPAAPLVARGSAPAAAPPVEAAGQSLGARVRTVARRFARAYLVWQRGHVDLQTRRALRAMSTPALWRTIERNRGRPVAMPGPPPRLGAVLVAGWQAAVMLAGRRRALLTTLKLARDGRRVRVTAITR